MYYTLYSYNKAKENVIKKLLRENTSGELYTFIEKNPHISGPMQFPSVLFKGQL